jgi:biopolymer transport protein ExbB
LIANLSPLIGLLGTVIGMINAFQALQNAGNKVDPSILSGGIWVALMTTAAGLIIAIPSAAAHNWMEGVVYRAQRAMEDAVTRVFTGQVALAPSGSEPAVGGTEAAQPAE